MAKVHIYEGLSFNSAAVQCPACNMEHPFRVEKPGAPPTRLPLWTWNGDMEKPTFSPSMLCTIGRKKDRKTGEITERKCHSFVRDGQIQFLPDSWHGRSDAVDLPDIEE